MSVAQETTVVWQPGTYVLWGTPEDETYEAQRGTVIEHGVAVGRGDHGEDLAYYEIETDFLVSSRNIRIPAGQVMPAYKPDLDAIPDIHGNLVRVGDWVEYARKLESGEYGEPLIVRVTALKPQRIYAERYTSRAKTDQLDLHHSSVEVQGYGNSDSGGFVMNMMHGLNLRGDWSSGVTRDGQFGQGLKRAEVSEEWVIRREIHANRNNIEGLDKAILILMRRREEATDLLEEQKAALAKVLG